MVVYAGAAGVILDGVRGNKYRGNYEALSGSEAPKSAGGEGIESCLPNLPPIILLKMATTVILATDGDF